MSSKVLQRGGGRTGAASEEAARVPQVVRRRCQRGPCSGALPTGRVSLEVLRVRSPVRHVISNHDEGDGAAQAGPPRERHFRPRQRCSGRGWAGARGKLAEGAHVAARRCPAGQPAPAVPRRFRWRGPTKERCPSPPPPTLLEAAEGVVASAHPHHIPTHPLLTLFEPALPHPPIHPPTHPHHTAHSVLATGRRCS